MALRSSFRICLSKCSNDAVLVATFHPTDPSLLITCGKSHIYFWSLDGGSLSKRQGLFEVSAECRGSEGQPGPLGRWLEGSTEPGRPPGSRGLLRCYLPGLSVLILYEGRSC